MPMFRVSSRKTGPMVVADIEAVDREAAIFEAAHHGGEGDTVEVFQCIALPAEPAPEPEPEPAKRAKH